MGLCKCLACPKRGNFEVGKYYGWLYAAGSVERTEHAVIQNVSESKHVKDTDGMGIVCT